MKNEITRAYSTSDDYMFEKSETLRYNYDENLADFTSFDGSLDAAFSTNWLSKIMAARTVGRDSQIKDILAQKTEIVVAIMDQCRLKYKQVKYFANKTFPNSKAKQAEFGTDSYMVARNNQSHMITFMDEMHKACTKYSVELLANDFTAPAIAEIVTLGENLRLANIEQEGYANGRPVLTQDRLIILNECYYETIRVVEAAQVIYYNDYARKNQFVFGNGTSGGGSNNDVPIVGVVLNSVTNAPVGNATVNINSSLGAFSGLTNALGEYSIVIQLAETENCPFNIMADNYQPFVQLLSIDPENVIVPSFALIPN